MFNRKLKQTIQFNSVRRNLLTAIILALLLGITVSVRAGTTADALAESEEGQIVGVIVDGKPPETTVAAASVPEPNIAAGINIISDVPAFDWSYGCSATSAAMLFGYYDRTGYSNMYTGNTNGGVCPLDNSVWGDTVYPSVTCHECPLSATHNGVDGRTIEGHVDDYWVDYGDAGPDPYLPPSPTWAEHTKGDCTGDYMGTNQSSFSNTDGSTQFFYYESGNKLYDYSGCEPDYKDGCHGMREFAESRGYTVVTNFTQVTESQATIPGNGFTFNDFQAEIDAGRPVLIHITGHTMLGYGYDTTGETIYIRNTWNHSYDTMPWDGTYSGKQHWGVTVIRLEAAPTETINPEATIDDIPDYIDSLTSISGTAFDTSPGELWRVQIELNNPTDSTYWNGINWVSTQTWLNATGTTSWSYDSSSITFTDSESYEVKARSVDTAGNESTEATDTFTFDTTAPTVTIEQASGQDDPSNDTTINFTVTFSESVSDFATGDVTISGTAGANTATVTGSEATYNVAVSGMSSDGTVIISLASGVAHDAAGNASAASTNTDNTVTYDSTAPTGSLNINSSAAYANSTSVTLNLSTTDAVGVTQYKIANGTDASGASATAITSTTSYSDDISWTLASGDGSKTVAVMYGDAAGNWSGNYTHSITLDTTSPSATITDIDDFVNALASVSGTASDDTSSVAYVELYIYNSTDSTYWNDTTTTWVTSETWLDATETDSWSYDTSSVSFTDAKVYQVKARATDNATNTTASTDMPSDSFTFDTTAPAGSLNINSSATYANSTSVTLNLSATDAVGTTQYKIANGSDASGASATAITSTTSYSDDISWTIPIGDGSKTVAVMYGDAAGNWSGGYTHSITLDTTAPSATVTDIDDFVNALASVSGTASDSTSGVASVELYIYDSTNSKYWSGTGWIATESWLNASGTTSWSYDTSSVTFSDAKVYQVKARATDNATNTTASADMPSDSFTFDTSAPSVTITDIDDFVNTLASVSGSASDTSPGQLQKVQISLKNATDNNYWDGSSWVTSETWLDATGIASWSLTMPSLIDSKAYQVTFKSIDSAGNESTTADDSFTFDTTAPSATVTNIDDFVNSLVSVSGTASDDTSGVASVELYIYNSTDSKYWSGTGWIATESWLGASGTTSWSYDTSSVTFSDGKAYQVKARATDNATNTTSSDDIPSPTPLP